MRGRGAPPGGVASGEAPGAGVQGGPAGTACAWWLESSPLVALGSFEYTSGRPGCLRVLERLMESQSAGEAPRGSPRSWGVVPALRVPEGRPSSEPP